MKIGGSHVWTFFEMPKTTQIKKRRHTIQVTPEPAPIPQSEPRTQAIWCHCRRCSIDDMVQCDNDDCPIQWYHMACVNMTMANVPNVWFCRRCR